MKKPVKQKLVCETCENYVDKKLKLGKKCLLGYCKPSKRSYAQRCKHHIKATFDMEKIRQRFNLKH